MILKSIGVPIIEGIFYFDVIVYQNTQGLIIETESIEEPEIVDMVVGDNFQIIESEVALEVRVKEITTLSLLTL